MADKYVFADEAGNFDFSTAPRASKHFILSTLTVEDCSVGDDLLRLRRELGWKGLHLNSEFHASDDPQAIRDEVFAVLENAQFRVDSTILEKRKAQPHLHSQEALYKLAWFVHFKHVAPLIATREDRLFVVASMLGTKKRRGWFHNAVDDVVDQVSPCRSYRVAFWQAHSDPCLWAADYCTWAVQRAKERNDTRSREIIEDKIKTEYDYFQYGWRYYY